MSCGTSFTFDFCDKPACLTGTVKARDDAETPHLPTHDLVKIRTNILHHREIGKVLRNSTQGLKRAKKLLERAAKPAAADEASSDGGEHQDVGAPSERRASPSSVKTIRRDSSDPSDSSDTKAEAETPVPTCVSCSEPIAQPCMYCIDCPGMLSALLCSSLCIVSFSPRGTEDANIFVCQSCEDQKGGVTAGDHQATHTLVRCLEPPADEDKHKENDTEKRVAALESQISALTSQMDRMEKLLQSLAHGRTADLVASGE